VAGKSFLMCGGGTAGHVMPLLAVAEELRTRGQQPFFIGTQSGFEGRLVPERNFPFETVEIGGFQGVGLARQAKLLYQLPLAIAKCIASIRNKKPVACFSLGGYAAAPPVIAATLLGLPVVVMEPNAIPGMVNRWMGKFAYKAMLSFPQAAPYFPARAVEISGLPVRNEFFQIEPRPESPRLSVLITGGSQGSQTLNRAARQLWPLLAESKLDIRLVHQCGRKEERELQRDFAATGLSGTVSAFIQDMPQAFAEADLVVCRSGAGTVCELAAAGRPAILVPFPFAADDHQTRNAEAMAAAGAGLLVKDAGMTGESLFRLLRDFHADRVRLRQMAAQALALRKPGAAQRAANLLLEFAGPDRSQ
jgi:UDP-N-acetylglucosamine--N-acetylmuramyl-(pentapeptide) pyrophosphoryl-undecaprenol N-acetylglucosamine transferase